MSWTTSNEIDFLHGLGGYRGDPNEPIELEKRLELLKKNQKAIPNRSNWGDIHRVSVELAIEKAIAKTWRLLQAGIKTIPNPNTK